MESSLIGLGGAVIGILLGHFLTRSSQHRQWLRDNRKQEFKEVVTAISQYIIEHMGYVASQSSVIPQSKQAYVDSMKATYCVLADRIYIHADLDEKKIPERFVEIMDLFRNTGTEFGKAADEATTLITEVIAMALKG